jgi:DNA-binding transcriptional LysR family regulator
MMAAQAVSAQRVQIGVAHNCLDYVLPFAYSARYQSATGIAVGLTVGPPELTMVAVEQRCLDFVITDCMPDADGALATETLYENPLFVVCAPHHPLESNKELALRDLVGQRWVACSSVAKVELCGIFERAGLPLPTVSVYTGCSSLYGRIASTQLLAVHAVPTVLALAEARSHVAVLRVKDLVWTRPVFAVYRSSDGLSDAAWKLIHDLKGLAISEANLR